MKVIYEITASVDEDLKERYERFMIENHIPDLLATGHFTNATMARSDLQYKVLYFARSQNALHEYLENEASQLREDFMKEFPFGVDVQRSTLDVLAELPTYGQAIE